MAEDEMAKIESSDKADEAQGKEAARSSGKQGKVKNAKQDARGAKSPAKPNPITRFIHYVEASRAELHKVTWPTARETRKATFAVLGFVGIMAIILGLIDLGLSSLIKAILS